MASRMKKLRQGETDRLASGEVRAAELETRTDEARQGFDAAEYAREVGRAQFEDFREEMTKDVENLRSNQVGRGRVNTGYGMEDEDRLISEGYAGGALGMAVGNPALGAKIGSAIGNTI